MLLQHLCKMWLCNYLSLSAAPFLLSTYLTHNASHKISQLYFILFWFESAFMFYTTAYYSIHFKWEKVNIMVVSLWLCESIFFPSLSIHNWAHFDFSSCFCSMVIMTLMSTSQASCPKRSCYQREWVWCWDGRRSMLIMLIMFAELCNEPVRLRRASRRALDVVKALGWKHSLACQ